MGFFSMHETCFICNQDTGFNKHKVKQGYLCQDCMSTLAKKNINLLNIKKYSAEELREVIQGVNDSEKDAIRVMNEKIEEYERTGTIYCPKCLGKNISADRKGMSAAKAAVGVKMFGVLGAAAGDLGANKVQITCLDCGHSWIAGKKK